MEDLYANICRITENIGLEENAEINSHSETSSEV